jgi:hypothetical protein
VLPDQSIALPQGTVRVELCANGGMIIGREYQRNLGENSALVPFLSPKTSHEFTRDSTPNSEVRRQRLAT